MSPSDLLGDHPLRRGALFSGGRGGGGARGTRAAHRRPRCLSDRRRRGPLAWNAILHDVGAGGFFVDAPVTVLPASWQDTGSGIFALAAATLALGFGPLGGSTGFALARASVACGLAAFLVDVYLY